MKALSISFFLAALCCTATFVYAEGPDDLWEMTMSMQSEGMTMPAMTHKICKKKGAMEADNAPLEKDCKLTDSKRSGAKYTFSFACDGKDGKYTGSGETETLGKDAYRGKMKSSGVRDGEKFDMSTAFNGKRVGTCTWEDTGKHTWTSRRWTASWRHCRKTGLIRRSTSRSSGSRSRDSAAWR